MLAVAKLLPIGLTISLARATSGCPATRVHTFPAQLFTAKLVGVGAPLGPADEINMRSEYYQSLWWRQEVYLHGLKNTAAMDMAGIKAAMRKYLNILNCLIQIVLLVKLP